jgi:hypothetical protein
MKGKFLKDNGDFQRAIVFQRDVEVWLDGEQDTVGKIEAFTDETVKINGSYYVREVCQFVMAK